MTILADCVDSERAGDDDNFRHVEITSFPGFESVFGTGSKPWY
jgi:hypothetical protein